MPLTEEQHASLAELEGREELPLRLDEPLSEHVAFGVGGPADIWVSGATDEQEALLKRWARKHKLPIHEWAPDDSLVSDHGIRGLVLDRSEQESGPEELSLFEQPRKGSVDALLADAGLRGVRVRGARINPEDGNRVQNQGGATAADVLLLIKAVQDRVAREFGLRLVQRLPVIGRSRPPR